MNMDSKIRYVKLRILGITVSMRSETFSRLKAGLLAGLFASGVLGFLLWLVGYTTPWRLTTSLISIAAVVIGLMAGAQAFISRPEELPQEDDVLAELEKKSQDKQLGRAGSTGGKGRRG